MRVPGRFPTMLGVMALAAVPGGCNRQTQPLAPVAVHQCPIPLPVAVVYHAAQDRWEIVLAEPDAAETDLPRTLPLQTFIDGRVVDGFVPSPTAFQQDNLRLTGQFPLSVEFHNGRWFVLREFAAVAEQPLLNKGSYGAYVNRIGSRTLYYIHIDGRGIAID